MDHTVKIPIFVYGTLMKGFYNHVAYLKDSAFVGEGSIFGYEMYNLGRYPGIIEGMGVVLGEVYLVTKEELDRIDILEEEGSLYVKQLATVTMLESGKMTEAWVYICNRSIDGCDRIYGKYGKR